MSDSTWSTPLLYMPAAISRRFAKTGLVPEGALGMVTLIGLILVFCHYAKKQDRMND